MYKEDDLKNLYNMEEKPVLMIFENQLQTTSF